MTPAPPTAAPRLRAHQRQLCELAEAIARGGAAEVRDVLAAVTPGGGKSLLPVIAAARLIGAGVVERVVWIVPRDSLRLQAEEAFADPVWRRALDHALSVRAADNGRDPSRGLAGYVTTYQAIAAAPALHLAEARRHRTLVVTDEVHHLPALGEEPAGPPEEDADLFAAEPAGPPAEDTSAWSRALAPVLGAARLRLHLSGTLERADGRAILWLPYRPASGRRGREVDFDAPGWRVIGYSRAQALRDRAVLPVTFGALDGEATWSVRAEAVPGLTAADGYAAPTPGGRVALGPHRLSGPMPTETTRPALFSALRTEFADALLREAFIALTELRAERRRRLGPKATRGLGKLLVVAPDQACARRYLDLVRAWLPPARAHREARLATSSERDAHDHAARVPADAGALDPSDGGHGLRGARRARGRGGGGAHAHPLAPLAGADDRARHPDRPPRGALRGAARHRLPPPTIPCSPASGGASRPSRARSPVPAASVGRRATCRCGSPPSAPRCARSSAPRSSPCRARRWASTTPRCAPAPSSPRRAARRSPRRTPCPSPPPRRRSGGCARGSWTPWRGRWWRTRARPRARASSASAPTRTTATNAVLKRVTGKGRREMGAAELEAALGWMERNRLRDHLHLLDGDARYAWDVRRTQAQGRRRARRVKAPDPRQVSMELD